MNTTGRVRPFVVLVAVMLAGAVLHVDFAHNALVLLGDQNTVPLMGQHIAQGRAFPVYFYGQSYMGGIGPYVIAGFFTILGPRTSRSRSACSRFCCSGWSRSTCCLGGLSRRGRA